MRLAGSPRSPGLHGEKSDVASDLGVPEGVEVRGVSMKRMAALAVSLFGKDEPLSADVVVFETLAVVKSFPKGSSVVVKGASESSVIDYYTGFVLLPSGNRKVKIRRNALRQKGRDEWTVAEVAFILVDYASESKGGAQYAEVLSQDEVSEPFKATMVSHPAEVTFMQLVVALKRHFKEKDSSKEFVWLESMSRARDSPRNNGAMLKVLGNFDRHIVFLDSWDQPSALRTPSILLEVALSLKNGIQVNSVLGPMQDQNLLTVLFARNLHEEAKSIFFGSIDLNHRDLSKLEIDKVLPNGVMSLEAMVLKACEVWLKDSLLQAMDKARELFKSADEAPDFVLVTKKTTKVLAKLGFFGEAESLVQGTVTFLTSSVLQSSDRQILELLNERGILLSKKRDFIEALKVLSEAMTLATEKFGERSQSVSEILNNIGSTLSDMGKFQRAIDHFFEALEIAQDNYGPMHISSCDIMENIAILYERQDELDQSLEWHQRVFDIRERVGSEEDYLRSALHIGFLLAKMHDFARSPIYLLIVLRTISLNDFETGADVHYQLGIVMRSKGEEVAALENFERSLNLLKSYLPEENEKVAECLFSLAESLLRLKRHDEALEMIARCLKIRNAIFGKSSEPVAQAKALLTAVGGL